MNGLIILRGFFRVVTVVSGSGIGQFWFLVISRGEFSFGGLSCGVGLFMLCVFLYVYLVVKSVFFLCFRCVFLGDPFFIGVVGGFGAWL